MKRMTIALLGLAGTALALAQPLAAQDAASPVVTVDTGKLRGTTEDGVESWKGIPFAAPPVGDLRWRAPQPAAQWNGVRDATQYSSDCMQKPFPSDAAPLGTTPAEDCLYANVWKPSKALLAAQPQMPFGPPAKTDKLPVMVWIYGGGFVNGGASPPTYSGANMAKQGLVFVSFNYRIGRFGTFAHPQLTKADADKGLLGNYGFLDQIAALKWVQKNIAQFGGDPDNVTIIGESAGGMSVNNLLTSPMSQDLFDKAIIMSGGNGQALGQTDLKGTEEIGVNFANAHGIKPNDPQALKKLRALSAEEVTDGLSMAAMFAPSGGPKTFASPFVDGKIAVNQMDAYQSGKFAHVPVMIGATSADMGGIAGMMVGGARSIAQAISAQGVPVYEYRFSYVADSVGRPGADHATDIPFFFDNAAIKYGDKTTEKDVMMGKYISSYLANFAKRGDPNFFGQMEWPRYETKTDMVMDFAADGKAEPKEDPWGEYIDAKLAEEAAAAGK
ncbi:carboxylesterase family protein [Altererythrobacter indicus]|uniref:Carboxylic ester hydrolase n=1 Tax=Altericroceibacterium indicum TaxID=374177 RepID=A0A845A6N5_9SPHN|nr:carboxylesterase family protein [Altericroceibacterium indicum]MXP24445.1 carboxylesterase family protein [Altericroceibacterium indicum]